MTERKTKEWQKEKQRNDGKKKQIPCGNDRKKNNRMTERKATTLHA
jgi:hypothetical protein